MAIGGLGWGFGLGREDLEVRQEIGERDGRVDERKRRVGIIGGWSVRMMRLDRV